MQDQVSRPLSIAFFVLWFIPTFAGLPLLLATLLFGRDVNRRGSTISLTVALIFAGVLHSLLLFASGFNLDRIVPSGALCASQASMIAGVEILLVFALMGIIHSMSSDIRDARKGASYKAASKTRKPVSIALLILPYASWTLILIASLITYATAHRLRSTGAAGDAFAAYGGLPYCAPSGDSVEIVMFFFNCAFIGIALGFEAIVLYTYMALRKDSEASAVLDHGSLARNAVMTGALTLLIGLHVGIARQSSVLGLILPLVGVLALGLYGSRPDVMRAWRTWLRIGDAGRYAAIRAETETAFVR